VSIEDPWPESEEPASGEPARSSWAPINLASVLDGDDPDDGPSMLLRNDGVPLAYPHGIHALNGEPESLKSALAQWWTVERVRQQQPVVYIDFETSARAVVRRLLAFGLDAAEIDAFVRYIGPDEPLAEMAAHDLDQAIDGAALAVLDGLNEALALHGYDSNYGLVPRRIANRGLAVAVIDHVAKSKEARGRWAVGSQQKLALVNVSYTFDLKRPGLSHLKLEKDRDGLLREALGGQAAAEIELQAEDGRLSLDIRSPGPTGADWKPTHLMEQVSRTLEVAGGELSKREIEERVRGRGTWIRQALESLVSEGFVSVRDEGRAKLHRSMRPYRVVPETGRTEDGNGQVT
jgi:hypothetical protein